MAIADRPILTPGPSAIQPYLSAGSARTPGRRAPWEDELDKLLLGIPQSEWAGIRGSLGLAPGGGYAPGGGGGGVTGGGGASAAPAAAFAAVPAAEGLRVGSVAPAMDGRPQGMGEGTGGGGFGPDNSGYGQTTDVLGVLGNMASFALGPLGFAGSFLGTAINDPTRTSVYGIQDIPAALGLTPASALGGMSNADIAGMSTQDFSGATGVGTGSGQSLSQALSETIGSLSGAEQSGPSGLSDGQQGMAGNDSMYRTGGPVPADGDDRLEPVKGTLHEGEFVLRPEAVAVLGLPLLELLNQLGGGKTGETDPTAFRDGGPVQTRPYQLPAEIDGIAGRTGDTLLNMLGHLLPIAAMTREGPTRRGMEALSNAPSPVGDLGAAALVPGDLAAGDWTSAGLNALGVLPFLPAMGGRIAETMYRGAAQGEHLRPGGFWSTSREVAEDFAKKAGSTGSVHEAPGFGGRTFGGIGEPVTIQDWLNVTEALARHNGPDIATQFARGLPVNVDVKDIDHLRQIARQHGGVAVAEGPEAGLALMQLRRLTGVNGANDALLDAGYGSVRYGRDAQLLDPATIARQ